MRRARLFPMIVVGLAGLSGQTAMLSPCRAWDGLPSAVLTDPAYSKPMDAHYVDDAVQQAGYLDSRRKPTAPPASAPAMPSAGMYRGQKVKMPMSLFGRKSASTTAQAPQQRMPAGAMNPNARGQVAAGMQPSPRPPMPMARAATTMPAWLMLARCRRRRSAKCSRRPRQRTCRLPAARGRTYLRQRFRVPRRSHLGPVHHRLPQRPGRTPWPLLSRLPNRCRRPIN